MFDSDYNKKSECFDQNISKIISQLHGIDLTMFNCSSNIHHFESCITKRKLSLAAIENKLSVSSFVRFGSDGKKGNSFVPIDVC